MPYDNMATFERALAPLRFSLDKRTGAIVVDDASVALSGLSSTELARHESMAKLISENPPH